MTMARRQTTDRFKTRFEEEILKAISIQQPWAWLIIRPDVLSTQERSRLLHGASFKNIENRSWSTSHRGDLAVHVSQSYSKRLHIEHADIIYREFGIVLPPQEDMKVGGVIGVVKVLGCVRESPSPWFKGPWGMELADPRPVEFVPMPGKLSLFEVPNEVIRPLQLHP